MPCCNTFAAPRTTPCPLDASKRKWVGSSPRRQSPGRWIGTKMDGEQVRGSFELWCRLLTDVGAAGVFCCRRRCPLRRSCQPRQALFKPKMCPLGGLPPGSQVGPSQVDGTSLCDNSFSSQQGSCSPVFGLLCGGASASCSHFCGAASGLHPPSGGIALGGGSYTLRSPFCGSAFCLHGPSCGGALSSRSASRDEVSTSHPHPAFSCAQGTNASDLAAVAFSALPVGSTPAVPSARVGAVARPVAAPPPRSCALMLEGSTYNSSQLSLNGSAWRLEVGLGYCKSTRTHHYPIKPDGILPFAGGTTQSGAGTGGALGGRGTTRAIAYMCFYLCSPGSCASFGRFHPRP